jgi:hypothetical protein
MHEKGAGVEEGPHRLDLAGVLAGLGSGVLSEGRNNFGLRSAASRLASWKALRRAVCSARSWTVAAAAYEVYRASALPTTRLLMASGLVLRWRSRIE